MKISKKIIIIILLLAIILIPILLTYCYLKVKNAQPLFAIEYNSNRVPHGIRYDGILFSQFLCKSDSKYVLKTRFTKFQCSADRSFVNGIYENEKGAIIKEEDFNKYFKDAYYYNGIDIDDYDQAGYDGLLYTAKEITNGELKHYNVIGKSVEGYDLVKEKTSDITYCALGYFVNANFILADYNSSDNTCIIPENICDYVNDKKVTLTDITLTNFECKCKCSTCE